MRAAYNNVMTLTYGPTGIIPGFAYDVRPCRLMLESHIVCFGPVRPLRIGYVTFDGIIPGVAEFVSAGGATYEYRWDSADRVSFASKPGKTYLILDLGAMTLLPSDPSYMRCSIANLPAAWPV